MPRKGVQVDRDTRRVQLFIIVGLMTAGVVGYGVWRAGTPTIPSASDTATARAEVSTIPESEPASLIAPAPETPTVSAEAAPQTVTPQLLDDPFLAPHAIVQAVPSTIAPTTVYRPENIRPVVPATEAAVEPTELASTTGQPSEPATPDVEGPEPSEIPDVTGEPTPPTSTPSAPDPELPSEPGPLEPQNTATLTPTEVPGAPEAFEASEPTRTTAPVVQGPVDTQPAPQEPGIERAAVTVPQPSRPISPSAAPGSSS